MRNLVRQVGILGPLVIFSVSVTALTFYQQLMEGPLVIKAAVAVILLASLVVSVVPQWRSIRAEELGMTLSRALTDLSSLFRDARAFRHRFELGESSVYDVAMRLYVEQLQNASVPFRTFFARDFRDGRLHAHPLPPEPHLIKDLEAAFIEFGTDDVVVLASPGIFNLDSWPQLAPENMSTQKGVREPVLRRRLAGRRFEGSYCIAVAIETETNRQRGGGLVALVVDKRVDSNLLGRFKVLLGLFERLTQKLWMDHVRMRLDAFFNRSYASLVRHGSRSIDEFARHLLEILIAEFALTDAKVRIRGMPQEETFGDGNYTHHLPIELGSCDLGEVSLGRRNLPFTENEKEALDVMEDEIDNHVRDLWQQSVLRDIDHNVLNKLPPSITLFLELLALELVKAFHADASIILVENGRYQGIYSRPDRQAELRGVASRFRVSGLVGPQEVSGLFYLATPISLSSRMLGIQILERTGKKFSEVEADCAKTLESHLDNILGLYLELGGEESKEVPSA